MSPVYSESAKRDSGLIKVHQIDMKIIDEKFQGEPYQTVDVELNKLHELIQFDHQIDQEVAKTASEIWMSKSIDLGKVQCVDEQYSSVDKGQSEFRTDEGVSRESLRFDDHLKIFTPKAVIEVRRSPDLTLESDQPVLHIIPIKTLLVSPHDPIDHEQHY